MPHMQSPAAEDRAKMFQSVRHCLGEDRQLMDWAPVKRDPEAGRRATHIITFKDRSGDYSIADYDRESNQIHPNTYDESVSEIFDSYRPARERMKAVAASMQ